MRSFAVAYPKNEVDREALRKMPGAPPIPAIYEGGKDMPCANCGIILNAGPRITTMIELVDLKVYCPLCAVLISNVDIETADVMHLGNPNSTPEKPR